MDAVYSIVFHDKVKSETVWRNCLKTYISICEYFVNRAQFGKTECW